MTDIAVAIPVGPNPAYLGWLPECIESAVNQTHKPSEIVIVNDGADATALEDIITQYSFFPIKCYKTLWNVGVADAFNFGIALANSELVFMLGSDDKLMPTCLEECVKEYEQQGRKDGWYNVTIITQGGEVQWIPNNAAAVTKGLWQWLGGFSPAAGLAACDALALSILMVHAPDRIIQVKQGTPLEWSREHEHQDTRKNMGYYAASGIVEVIRNMETARFVPRGTLK